MLKIDMQFARSCVAGSQESGGRMQSRSYLIIYLCSRDVSMHRFCPVLFIVLPGLCQWWRLLGLLDSIVSCAECLCEDELCILVHRRKVRALCLLLDYQWTVLWMGIWIILWQLIIRELQLHVVSLPLWFHAAELINSVCSFCLLLSVCELYAIGYV